MSLRHLLLLSLAIVIATIASREARSADTAVETVTVRAAARFGIDGSMVRTVGRAASQPVASNDDDAGRAQNRRTEIEFQGVRAATR